MPANLHPHKFHSLIRRRGEPCRWFKAFRATDYDPDTKATSPSLALDKIDGWVYLEQALPPRAVVYVDEVKRSVFDQEYGYIQKVETSLWTMPSVLPLARPDIVVLTHPLRGLREPGELLTVTDIAQGQNDFSPPLVRPFAKRVLTVTQGTRIFAADTDYTFDAVTQRLRFIAGAAHRPILTNGFAVVSVEYEYWPRFFVVQNPQAGARPSRYGEALPQMVLAALRHPDARDAL